jgi:hypothetical protein
MMAACPVQSYFHNADAVSGLELREFARRNLLRFLVEREYRTAILCVFLSS